MGRFLLFWMLMMAVCSSTVMTAESLPLVFKEDFNVFRGAAPANWQPIVTSSDEAEAFIRGRRGFRMISPSNMFMPLVDPISDGRVECTIQAYGFNPECHYGFQVNFRQDVFRRVSQSIRFLHHPVEKRFTIAYGTCADNYFRAIAVRDMAVSQDALKSPCELSVDFSGRRVTASFLGQKAVFDDVGGEAGQISICRMNFFDSFELTNFRIYAKEPLTVIQRKHYRVVLPEEPVDEPFYCDVELSEHHSFYEATLSLSGGSYLTPAGQGSYHGLRGEKLDHPYFKVITATKTTEYNLLDEAMILFVREIAPKHLYTVMHKPPEWPFRRTVRFPKPTEPFMMAVGAKYMACRVFIDQAMKDWESIFTPDGEVLFQGSSPENHVTASLFSSPEKRILSRIPGNSTKVPEALAFAKRNHYFYPGEPLAFTLQLQGERLPHALEITLANAFLQPIKTIEAVPECTEKMLGVRVHKIRCYQFTLPQQPVGVYHILLKSLDPTMPVDNFFAFEVMPEDPRKPTAAMASGLPFMYCALTETRGLRTDGFDPFGRCDRPFSHYISGTVFLPWYARETNLYDTVHLYGRSYFAWLGSRCLDQWHLADTMDIVKKADFAHFGVELETGSLASSLYMGRRVRDLVEFAKQTGDPAFDIPRMERIAGLFRHKSGNTDDLSGLEGQAIDAETYRYVVTKYFPQWLDFENSMTAAVIHQKLVELRKENPGLKFACYGPAPIYTGRYPGPEFVRYLSLAKTSPEDVGYLQYEDYPELCNYPESRGAFFLGTIAMAYPNIRVAAEMYGDGIAPSGCPDGAVFFAHPPYGASSNNYPRRTRNRVYEYTYATAFLRDGKFHYWDRYALQYSLGTAERIRNFLQAWGNTMGHLPVRPMRSAAYVFSHDSWNANQCGDAHFKALGVQGGENSAVMDAARVRKHSGEFMAFFYENVSNSGLCAGFQLMASDLKNLEATACDVLVLPPLKGVPSDQQKEIRRLYEEGVSIVCSEDPGELADIFQVRDGGSFVKVTMARGTAEFLPGMRDYTTDVCFGGRYLSDGAKVLIDGEIPVLYAASNGRANAYFFNVPPTTATADMLWERFSYGRQLLSELMIASVREIYRREQKVEVQASSGRVLAAETAQGFVVTHTNNSDEEQIVELTFKKRQAKNHLVSIDRPCQMLIDDDRQLRLRFTTDSRSSAFIVVK